MATYIKDLKEDNGDITRPVTEAGAVLLSGGGDLETTLASKADQTAVNNKISVGDVQSTDIVSNAVTTAKIAGSAVTTAKLADGSVTTAKLDPDATGMVYLGRVALTATASQLDFNVPTTYDNYKVLAKLTYVSASNAWLDVRLLNSGGTAIHNYHQVQRVTGTAWGSAINQDVIYAINSTGGAGDQAINLDMTITKSGTSWITYQAELDVGAGTTYTTNRAYGRIATATSPSTLRIVSGSAFAVGGWIKVWGWNN